MFNITIIATLILYLFNLSNSMDKPKEVPIKEFHQALQQTVKVKQNLKPFIEEFSKPNM